MHFDYLKTLGIDAIRMVESELPPNFFKLVYHQFTTIDGWGKITIMLSLFLSFNFYAYMYIKGGLMELDKERLAEKKADMIWIDLFGQPNSIDSSSKSYFVGFDETVPYGYKKNNSNYWHTNTSIATRFYTGLDGSNMEMLRSCAIRGASTLEDIFRLRTELSTSLFKLLSQKPNTSFFANVLYLLWLPFALDEKNRLLRYRQKELGEIVLEILHKRAIYNSAEQFQNRFAYVFLTNDLKLRHFIMQNMQLLVTNIELKIFLQK
jgi:hypothetical protein